MEKAENKLSYDLLRQAAFKANEKMPTHCHGCRGKCCTREVEITRDDADLIMSGVRSGEINQQTTRTALDSADIKDSNRCPFLAGEDKCAIYDFRPIICVIYSAGGLFNSGAARRFYREKYKSDRAAGKETYVNRKDLVTLTCEGCEEARPSMVGKSIYPYANVALTELIAHHVDEKSESDVFTLTDFVNAELKGLSSSTSGVTRKVQPQINGHKISPGII